MKSFNRFLSHCDCTHNDRLPLEVDVVDAHRLVGRESNHRMTRSICDVNLTFLPNYLDIPISLTHSANSLLVCA